MQTQNQPTGKAHLLSDDGELRIGLPLEDNVAPMDISFGEPRKNKAKKQQSAFRDPIFWLISIGYPLIFTGLAVLSQLYGGAIREIILSALIPFAFVVGLVGLVGYWRFNRHVALGFFGGLIGLFVIVPTITGIVVIVELLFQLRLDTGGTPWQT